MACKHYLIRIQTEISVAVSCIGLYHRTLWPANDDTYLQLNYVRLHHNYNYWTKFWNDGILKPSKVVLSQCVRRGLQFNPMFTDGFKSSKVYRHFVYLRGVLYGLASSQKVLCIDLNTIKARAFEHPHVLGDDDKTGATMGCLGVSKDLVCYVTCDGSNTFCFWSYNDRRESGDQWTLKYSVVRNSLVWGADTMFIPGADMVFKPYAISLNAHVIFCGTLELTFSWDFESQKCKLFNKSKVKWPKTWL